ncbi:hypothetical protein GM3709_2203 [Geminocystis sp. NIES-3709]|nr:hypothetical protein GM3709_2203 [Geminocystis sp. NIES-3709]
MILLILKQMLDSSEKYPKMIYIINNLPKFEKKIFDVGKF